jgi:hypothetical protein
LADFSGLNSPDWEQETLDLTPYVGQTIQLVWWYQGVSFGDPLFGWLVDDVQITGTSAGQGGKVIVSANLGQASFNLSGPVNRSGSGTLTTLTNVPAGDYTITFGDVPFYQTPAPQSGTLTNAGEVLNFSANYTFIDANHNGISDAWEKYYFGTASTNRTASLDSDGDGMSDYAEFLAGTDPTNAASKLVFVGAAVQNNSAVQFQWSAVPGRSYQVQTSSDFKVWTAATDWLRASGSPMSFTVTNSAIGLRSYRIQVKP